MLCEPEWTTNPTNIAAAKTPAAGSQSALWSALHEAGKEQLDHLIATVSRVAPEPGALVLIEARHIRGPAGNLPILYSSIDACTHLQIARLYFTKTVASSLDFLAFVLRSFPFQTKGIVTRADDAFAHTGGMSTQHRFTLTTVHLGIRHAVC